MTTIFWHQIILNALLRSPGPIRTLAFLAQVPWNQNLRKSRSLWCGLGWACLKSAVCRDRPGPTMLRITSVHRGDADCAFRDDLPRAILNSCANCKYPRCWIGMDKISSAVE